jgi:acyl dehydratase
MAIRGVYSKEEKKMLANFENKVESMHGWNRSMRIRVASEESIKNFAGAVDCWNPLWNDKSYAATTRWGDIIAPPLYQYCMLALLMGSLQPEPPPGAGYLDHWYIGEDWEFFKPIHINDSFRIWRRAPILADVTNPDGKGFRKFSYLKENQDLINHKDELVSTHKLYTEYTLLPEPPVPQEVKPLDDYVYTQEELEYIERIEKSEKIRGADIRYWEDVKIGDETSPVITGPTTVWDMISFFAGFQEIPFLPGRELRRRIPGMFRLDPATGVKHCDVEWHFSNNQALFSGEPHAFHFGAFARQLMVRLATNWMGDDGFLRGYKWRHLKRTAIGDTLIGKGKVINKYIKNGEHLVDLEIHLENLRGNITEAALATISLFSKEVFKPR